jgi:histidinol-phosphate phosphatase family protein
LTGKFTVFLDRDGIINRRLVGDYVKSWEEFEFLPGVLGALKRLAVADRKVIIISNQSGIGRGLMQLDDLEAIHREMKRRIEKAGGEVDKIYVCPHHPDDNCSCRKPQPGLLLQAADECNIDLAESFFVGDSPTDIEAGNCAGCITIKVDTEQEPPDTITKPRYRAKNLSDAVEIILSDC